LQILLFFNILCTLELYTLEMKKIISGRNLTSVMSQSGGYLSSGYRLHRSVANLNLKKSKYLKGFNRSMKGGSIRSGSEVRPFIGAQNHKGGSRGNIKKSSKKRKQHGGSVRAGTEVRPYGGVQTAGGSKTKRKRRKSLRKKKQTGRRR
jgi:hypothetical protein